MLGITVFFAAAEVPAASENELSEPPSVVPPAQTGQVTVPIPDPNFRVLGPPSLEELNRLFPENNIAASPIPARLRPSLPASSAATAPVEQMLASEDPLIRVRAVEALSAVKGANTTPLLLLALADPDAAVQQAARSVLATVPPESLADSIVAVLGWGEMNVAQSIDAVLPHLRNELERPLLARFEAKDALRIEKMTIAYCLGRIGSRSAGSTLVKQVWGDDLILGYYCADALATIDDQTLLREYLRMAGHPQVYMRTAAYRGLARIGGVEARSAMTEAAAGRTEPDTAARKVAIRLLAYVGNDDTVEFLIGLVRARTGLVETASDALATMTGLPHGLQRERWLEWYDEVYVPTRPQRPTQQQSPRAQAGKPGAPPPIGFPQDGFPFQP